MFRNFKNFKINLFLQNKILYLKNKILYLKNKILYLNLIKFNSYVNTYYK